jgi:hypothetical protein
MGDMARTIPPKRPDLGWAAGRRGHLGQDGIDPGAVDQPSIDTLAVFGPLACGSGSLPIDSMLLQLLRNVLDDLFSITVQQILSIERRVPRLDAVAVGDQIVLSTSQHLAIYAQAVITIAVQQPSTPVQLYRNPALSPECHVNFL